MVLSQEIPRCPCLLTNKSQQQTFSRAFEILDDEETFISNLSSFQNRLNMNTSSVLMTKHVGFILPLFSSLDLGFLVGIFFVSFCAVTV